MSSLQTLLKDKDKVCAFHEEWKSNSNLVAMMLAWMKRPALCSFAFILPVIVCSFQVKCFPQESCGVMAANAVSQHAH